MKDALLLLAQWLPFIALGVSIIYLVGVVRWCRKEGENEGLTVSDAFEGGLHRLTVVIDPHTSVEEALERMNLANTEYAIAADPDSGRRGLVSRHAVERYLADHEAVSRDDVVLRMMKEDPVTVAPDTSIKDAISLMRQHCINALPVVAGEEVLGIATRDDLLEIAQRVLSEREAF